MSHLQLFVYDLNVPPSAFLYDLSALPLTDKWWIQYIQNVPILFFQVYAEAVRKYEDDRRSADKDSM